MAFTNERPSVLSLKITGPVAEKRKTRIVNFLELSTREAQVNIHRELVAKKIGK